MHEVLRKLLSRGLLPLALATATVSGCDNARPTAPADPPDPPEPPVEVRWVHATITPFVLVHLAGAVLITVEDPQFAGGYEAELYLEAADGSWYVPAPFWDANWQNWFLVLHQSDGSVTFNYPQWWSTGTFRIHIAVRPSQETAISSMPANIISRAGRWGWSAVE